MGNVSLLIRANCPISLQFGLEHLTLRFCVYCITTRTPAVPDVFESGRNGGPLCPGRRVGFR